MRLPAVLNELRPLPEGSVAISARMLLVVSSVDRQMPRIFVGVDEPQLAVWTVVRIFAVVLLDLVLPQLRFPTELLIALRTGIGKGIGVRCLEMPVHVALQSKESLTGGLLARNKRWLFFFQLVR